MQYKINYEQTCFQWHFQANWLPFHLALLGPCIFASNQLKLFLWYPPCLWLETSCGYSCSNSAIYVHLWKLKYTALYYWSAVLLHWLLYFENHPHSVHTITMHDQKSVYVHLQTLCILFLKEIPRHLSLWMHRFKQSVAKWGISVTIAMCCNNCNNCNVLFTTIYSKQKTSKGKIVTWYLW